MNPRVHDHLLPKVEALAKRGLNNTEIGKGVGLFPTQVWRLRNPEAYQESTRKMNAKRAAAKRAWERDPANRAKCQKCGAPTGGSPKPSAAKACRPCHVAAENARVAERGHRIERMWAGGLALGEIADRLGWSMGHLQVEFNSLRAKGFDLPYRYKLSRPRHESQVAP